jgi:hypothetical protein
LLRDASIHQSKPARGQGIHFIGNLPYTPKRLPTRPRMMRRLEFNFGAMALYYNYTEMHPKGSGFSLGITRQDVRKYNCIIKRPHWPYINFVVRRDYSSLGRTGSTSTLPCAATTRHPAARALRQPCHASRVLISRPQQLYIDYAVRRRDIVFWPYDYFDYSSRLVNLSRAATTSSKTSRIHLRLVDFSNNRRGSITDRHGFVDIRSLIKLSHLFQ